MLAQMLGTMVGKYRITAKLGQGGMGIVYEAYNDELDKRAVIKMVRPNLSANPEVARRFANEAKAAASIQHPGIVDVLDIDRHDNGCLYILMEYLDGETLGDRLRRVRALPELVAMSFAQQTARALAAAHDKGIIHRDLKPDNIFLVRDPDVASGERVKLLDFGTAKLMQQEGGMTYNGLLLGTPPYMSPEQCRGAADIDLRCDLYALGIILFEMVCGRRPFVCRSPVDYLAAHLNQRPPPASQINPEVSDGLSNIIARLLAKDPGDRFASATDLLTAIDDIIGSQPGVVDPLRRSAPRTSGLSNATPAPARPASGASPRHAARDDDAARTTEMNRFREPSGGALRAPSLRQRRPSAGLRRGTGLRPNDYERSITPTEIVGGHMSRTSGLAESTPASPDHGPRARRRSNVPGLSAPHLHAPLDENAHDSREWDVETEVAASRIQPRSQPAPRQPARSSPVPYAPPGGPPAPSPPRSAPRPTPGVPYESGAVPMNAGHSAPRPKPLSNPAPISANEPYQATPLRSPVEPYPQAGQPLPAQVHAAAMQRLGEPSVPVALTGPYIRRSAPETQPRSSRAGQVLLILFCLLVAGGGAAAGYLYLWPLVFPRNDGSPAWQKAPIDNPDAAHATPPVVTPRADASSTQAATQDLGVVHIALADVSPMRFVKVPGGELTMGSPDSEQGRVSDERSHPVRVTAFALAEHEITQEQWQAVMGKNPSECDAGCAGNLPVQNVSWHDAIEFLDRLSERDKLEPCYTVAEEEETVTWNHGCTGYRLPTEAEWELACRSGTTTAYAFGDAESDLAMYAWYSINAAGKLHPVGELRPNRWGLYDMHGNVWEWVWDWHAPYPTANSATLTDPTGPEAGTGSKVLRGGSFTAGPWYLRCAARRSLAPSFHDRSNGLRPARSLTDAARPAAP